MGQQECRVLCLTSLGVSVPGSTYLGAILGTSTLSFWLLGETTKEALQSGTPEPSLPPQLCPWGAPGQALHASHPGPSQPRRPPGRGPQQRPPTGRTRGSQCTEDPTPRQGGGLDTGWPASAVSGLTGAGPPPFSHRLRPWGTDKQHKACTRQAQEGEQQRRPGCQAVRLVNQPR